MLLRDVSPRPLLKIVVGLKKIYKWRIFKLGIDTYGKINFIDDVFSIGLDLLKCNKEKHTIRYLEHTEKRLEEIRK